MNEDYFTDIDGEERKVWVTPDQSRNPIRRRYKVTALRNNEKDRVNYSVTSESPSKALGFIESSLSIHYSWEDVNEMTFYVELSEPNEET